MSLGEMLLDEDEIQPIKIGRENKLQALRDAAVRDGSGPAISNASVYCCNMRSPRCGHMGAVVRLRGDHVGRLHRILFQLIPLYYSSNNEDVR